MGVFFLNYEPKLQNVADQSQEMYFFRLNSFESKFGVAIGCFGVVIRLPNQTFKAKIII